MECLPDILNVKNKFIFVNIKYKTIIKILRKSIYDHLLKYEYENNENDTYLCENNCFDIEVFFKENNVEKKEEKDYYFKIIKEELNDLGWNCILTFGESALFIFSTEKQPTNCWKDEF